MKVALLAGGTGGAKLAHGFALLGDGVELSVIANVGDDLELHGLHVSPDIDALLYTLAGLVDTERGWGVRADTHSAQGLFERYGAETWFNLGDADLATHVERTRRLREGETLTAATARMADALGIAARILPATDDRLRTRIETDDGTLDFQEYFVRRRQEPRVRGIELDGVEAARATDDAVAAVREAELVVIGPSNPLVSIGPILAVAGMREAFEATSAGRIAVSPIIGGRALKGPADRMLASLGHEVSAVGVARLYADIVDRFVIDAADERLVPEVEATGVAVDVLPTVMRDDDDRRGLASALLDLAKGAPG